MTAGLTSKAAGDARSPARGMMVAAALAAVLSGCQPALVAAGPPAQDSGKKGNRHVWEPRTKSIAVFKNGLGFVMRQGEVDLRDGWCVAGEVPPAAFGTLAIYAVDEGAMVDVVGSGPGEVVEFDGRDAPDDPAVRRDWLETAKGLKVQLHYEHRRETISLAAVRIIG